MPKEYLAVFLVAVICVLMSMEVEGQSTVDGSETCSSGCAYTSDQVAQLIRKGVEKVIASKPCDTCSSKQSLVSALVCEYRS